MSRLSSVEVTYIKYELRPLLASLGLQIETTHPNWSRAHGYGAEHRAIEDFVTRIDEIRAGNNLPANPISLERVEAVEEPGGGRTEPMRDDKQSTDASSLTPVFDGSNGR